MRNAKVIPHPRSDPWARALLIAAIGFAMLSVSLLAFA